jgi:hypothetical protein
MVATEKWCLEQSEQSETEAADLAAASLKEACAHLWALSGRKRICLHNVGEDDPLIAWALSVGGSYVVDDPPTGCRWVETHVLGVDVTIFLCRSRP